MTLGFIYRGDDARAGSATGSRPHNSGVPATSAVRPRYNAATMGRTRAVIIIGRVLMGFALCIAGTARAQNGHATPEQVEAAIQSAQRYLIAAQKADGSFELTTALPTYALLCSGLTSSEPHVAK